MAQQIVSWFVSDGRFRVHAINAVGRRKGRIIEVEEVDSGERFHGAARTNEATCGHLTTVQRRIWSRRGLDA
jgi:hypothetical protein